MKRMVSVWLPHWAMERWQRTTRDGLEPLPPDKTPFVLAFAGTHGLVVTAANPAARRDGIEPGLRLADARARVPHLLSAPAEPGRDARALLELARWCGRYSPALNVDGPDGLWIDASGVAHLFGGETALLADIRDRLATLGITARAAIADTLGAAWALARFTPVRTLAEAPVEALRLSSATVTLLKRLGLYRVGQLAELPRESLSRRFPSKAAAEAVLLRLDQALGRRAEPRAPLVPPARHAARLAFAEPLISAEAFTAALDHLARDLCAGLTRAGQGVRDVAFTVYRSDGTSARVGAGLSAPSRSPEHLTRLLGEKVATLDAGFGVDALTLAATTTERLADMQESLAEEAPAPARHALIDRLASRLEPARVTSLVPQASHIPERAERHGPALHARELAGGEIKRRGGPEARPGTNTNRRGGPEARPGTNTNRRGGPEAPQENENPPKPPRPFFLIDPPEAIGVIAEIPEGPPARFTWRRVTRRVSAAEGPERIAPEWWREIGTRASRPRDYYRIEDEAGRRYWVFRDGLYRAQAEEGTPGWFLHGIFP